MTSLDSLTELVAAAVREVSETVIEPRFNALLDGDVEEKSPGEIVTVADRDAEMLLTTRLEGMLPGVPVIGEEACAVDPGRLGALGAERVWLVDPLDGTPNFVAGSPDWAVMIALLEAGATVASWIWQPIVQRMYLAERGAGAFCNGVRLQTGSRPSDASDLHGAVLSRFLDPVTAKTVTRNTSQFAAIASGRRCAGVEYPALIDGDTDFVLFWRTLPWDHAPGVLLVEEAGGTGRRPDGSRYRPGADGVGLLVAADSATWDLASQILA